MKLEEKLVALRKEKGLSQLKLAEMMNVSRQAISRWEVGAAAPSTENLKYLGALYHVPLEYLLNEDAPEPVRTDADSSQETEPHEGTGKQNTRTMDSAAYRSRNLCNHSLRHRFGQSER